MDLPPGDDFFKEIVEKAHTGIASHKPDGVIIYLNQYMADLMGYPRDSIIGRSSLDFIDKNESESVIQIQNELKDQRCITRERRIIRQDGSVLWTRVNLIAQVDTAGSLTGYTAIHTDITGQKIAEEALVKSKETFRDLVESSGSIIMKTDRELNITYMNDYGLNFFGYNSEEVSGRHVVGTIIPKRDDTGRDLLEMAAEIKNTPRSFGTNAHQNMRKNGELVWVSWTNVPKYDKDGNFSELLAIGNDITKLIKTEDALRESQRKAEMLIKYAPTGIFELDYTGPEFLSVNDAMCQITGYSREELLSLNPLRLLERQSAVHFSKKIRKILSGEKIPEHTEYQIKVKDGRELWTTLNFKILSDDGKSSRVLVIAHDITRSKHLEEKLKKYNETLEEQVRLRSEEILRERKRLYEVLETLPVYVVLLDKDYKVPFANKFFRERFGESQGKRCYEYLFNMSSECEDCETYKVMRTKRPHSWEWTGPDDRNYEIYDFPFDEADGSMLILEMGIDITARKKAEAAFRAEHKRLYDMLDSLPVMISLLTPDYRIAFANRTLRDKFGEPNGRPCFEYCYNKTEPCEFCKTYKVLETGTSHHWEVSLMDGTIIEVNDFPFSDVDGSPLILKMDVDITRQKRAEAELRKQQEHLQDLNQKLLRSNKELESFAYITSHDLQEPLRMVTSFTQLLARKFGDDLDQDVREYIGFIIEGSKRMYDQINGLLNFSRISRKEISFTMIDTNSVLDTVRSDLQILIEERNCTIKSKRLPVICADHTQIKQLFQNLITNGIKFSLDNPRIIISSKKRESDFLFSVKDQGIGIESQYYDKIFEIFKRLNPRDQFDGTGIGLAICKRIVENHNGKIWVESVPGSGSVFYFTIPVNKTE